MNIVVGAVMILNGGSGKGIPNSVGYLFLGMLAVMLLLGLLIAYLDRNNPKPVLKRTKNPYRRFKRIK